MELRIAMLFTGLALAGQLWLATEWSLLADEAYYAFWSETPAWGYYDQPPVIAWLIATTRWFGDSDLGVRLPAILLGTVSPFVLWRLHGTRDFALWWWLSLPPLMWLGFFATPDAPLLFAWSVALAGAARGGRGWWLAGLAGAIATLCKYSGLAVFPLAVLGARDRSRDVGIGAVIHGAVLVPHLLWLATHDAVSVRFQLVEGLMHAHAPGVFGPVQVVLQQLGVLTPLTAIAIVWAWWKPTPDRIRRIAWWTSAPLFVFFLLASVGGPPEAHWPAPAWIGAGILLSHARGPLGRLAWVAMGVGLLASFGLVLHAQIGLLNIPVDPADRVREGPVLAEGVASWVLPEGVGIGEEGAARAIPVYTERYQEASLIRWYAGIDARAHPDCGRPNQFSGRPNGPFYFVRPPTTHPPTCVEVGDRHSIVGQDLSGRVVGRWELFEPVSR